MLYRAPWTCGRFDEKSHSAIFYSLIDGLVYSFTEESADVVGLVLAVGRNGALDEKHIADMTGIAIESIVEFLEELSSLNLVVTSIPTPEQELSYRTAVASSRRGRSSNYDKTVKEKLPMFTEEAETEYTNRVGGITSVMFEMTYRCPEKCIHCYNPGATRNDSEISHRGDRKEMTLEDYKRVIDQLYEQGLYKVCLSGGDPFSHKAVWDVLDYLYSKEIAIDIFTNGQSIQRDVERIARYYPRLIGVSIYSGKAAEHDYVTRIKGSWERSMSVVKQFAALAVPMNMKCCVMRPTLKHYYEVEQLAQEYGAQSQFEVSLCDSIENDACVSKYLRLTEEQLEVVLRDSNVPLYIGKEAPNYGGQKREMNAPLCGAGKNSFCISPEGYLMPCCAFHLELGNVRIQSVAEIIETSIELKDIRTTTYGKTDECGTHEYCDYCNMCPGKNYSERGSYLKASHIGCWQAKVRYNLACKMQHGYDPLNGYSLVERISQLDSKIQHNIQQEFVPVDEN